MIGILRARLPLQGHSLGDMKKSLLITVLILIFPALNSANAVDLSDTKRPSIKVRSITEVGLPSDVVSVEIEYSDDKNLLREFQLPYQIERAVQDLEAAPVCKLSVFSLPLQYLSKGEDLSKRQVSAGSVKQYFVLRYLNQISRVDNGCPYPTKALVNGWGFWPFDEPLLTLNMEDQAGNRALWDGVATATGVLPGNTSGQIAKLPFDLTIKKLKSVCDTQITSGQFSCQLAQKALHASTNQGLTFDGYGLNQTGLHNSILSSRQSIGNFNQSTYSFDSWSPSISSELRSVISIVLAIYNPLLPKLEDVSVTASVKRYNVYQQLVTLADLSQNTNIVTLWNDWVAKAVAEAKAKAEAEAKAKAESEAKAKAETDSRAAAEKVLCDGNRAQLLSVQSSLIAATKSFPKSASPLNETLARLQSALRASCVADVTLNDFRAEALSVIAQAKTSSASRQSTITCVKGKLTKKVKAVNPKCPKGYKKR